ncbi:ribonuclease E inhibitor RraB [Parapedobacter koreensis]|uniref:Regulator of ribonuclease activity B n=1 Tax=Parapedobacter koreensis TaxID=332977 RepID=A0A1H7UBD9_9SPHI|nr:ribonuclease E inhibitor RraB [Parapedobacter koreensis]SEL94271.1 Regulator of ribonuclease activity B [Parapedobacter koreensis]
MGLFDFLKPKSKSGQFVTEVAFNRNRDKQMQMATQTLDQLRKVNVPVGKELKLEYFFYTNTAEKAERLANEIGKLNYSVRYGISAGDKKLFIITGWTTEMEMADDVVTQWTKHMCELGYQFDCEFDGWGTDPNQDDNEDSLENAFEGLRSMAFSTEPDQLRLALPIDKTVVYGVIMDWEMGGAIATITSYQTGDASLYLSSGGGIIGGGQHENVNNAAKQLVSLAQSFLDKATKTQATTLPTTGQIKFHLLTNNGIYVGHDIMENLEDNSSTWLKLFEEGNRVLTELRMTTEDK